MNSKPLDQANQHTSEFPASKLEKIFIEEYIVNKGYKLAELDKLPANEHKQLMIDASIYASVKMAEVETRARLIKEIHDASHSVTS